MDPARDTAVAEWTYPKNTKALQMFPGFANFYRCFIQSFSDLTFPLTHLLLKDAPFVWTPSCATAFDTLKLAFTFFPVLCHYDFQCTSPMETDASDFAILSVLSQDDEQGHLHPIAFYSRQLLPLTATSYLLDRFRAASPALIADVSDDPDFTLHNGLVFHNELLVPPTKDLHVEVISHCHDAPLAGHFRVAKTCELDNHNFWWSGYRHMIKSYIAGCDAFLHAKLSCHKPFGLLQPLPIHVFLYTSSPTCPPLWISILFSSSRIIF
jgi:hypothetical protein